MVANGDNRISSDDIGVLIQELNELYGADDDPSASAGFCYWFGYQDALYTYEDPTNNPVTLANLNEKAARYDYPEEYKKGFHDATGDLEIWEVES